MRDLRTYPGAGDDALVPLTSGPPLTAREEELLRLIKGLQERVASLEARDGSDAGDVQPAAEGDYQRSSQARLLEACATKTLDPNSSGEQRKNNIDKAAQNLLLNYPPK